MSFPKMALAVAFVVFCEQATAFSSQPAALLQRPLRQPPPTFRLASTEESDDETFIRATFESYIAGKSTNVVFEDTVVGNGENIQWGKMATIKYTGRLLVGDKEFDKGTFGFKVGMGTVIQGWDQGLLGMKVGGKRTLKVPPNMAYGTRGSGDKIPPDADLIFDCELKGVGDTGTVGTGPIAEAAAKFRAFFKS